MATVSAYHGETVEETALQAWIVEEESQEKEEENLTLLRRKELRSFQSI
jgi:hypothetical protein